MFSFVDFPAGFRTSRTTFRRVLAVLWLGDGLFMAAFVVARFLVFLGLIRFVPNYLNLTIEYQPPEYYNYLKWMVCIAALWIAWWRCREALFACLAVLCIVLGADDSLSGHEIAGRWFAANYALPTPFGIGPNQVGEVVFFAGMGVIATALIVVSYLRSSRIYWPFAHRFVFVIAGLAVCGVLFDSVHNIVAFLPRSHLATALEILVTLVEDGGELVFTSLAAAYSVGAARMGLGVATGVIPAWPAAIPVLDDSPDRPVAPRDRV